MLNALTTNWLSDALRQTLLKTQRRGIKHTKHVSFCSLFGTLKNSKTFDIENFKNFWEAREREREGGGSPGSLNQS